jgi:hypothetical protein
MRKLLLGVCLSAMATAALAQSDPAAPKGKLTGAALPTAYRLDLTILPDQPRFSGHAEIDVKVKAATRSLYLHGRDLKVSKAEIRIGGKPVAATWTQVDPTGVVRLDFAAPVPAGPATLAFDYDGAFGDTAAGLYHIKVGDAWYSWTQFESTDARAAYPGFDEPGFKTPFTISVTTRPGFKAVSNSPEIAVEKAGELEVHRFQTTKPLPTYLVAIDTGPFLHQTGVVPPTPQRAAPLPLGAVATQAQVGKLDYVMAETPRIVQLLERYFDQPFPFPKLDQIATPEMPGAMENAGADTYADEIIVLDSGATTRQKQEFGMVVAHELSHQWFGDLVTPAWWDDIWLNESFANWMGYRIGQEWRPELNIGVGALAEGLNAMNTDALEVGRPIHQPILTNGEIDSAFDSITYGKGGQVVAMIAAYMGDDAFKAGVRLHLSRHMYGNATTDQFFGALADSAHDPRILAAMRSFVDQPGVPLVTFARAGDSLVASQSRYAFLGSKPKPETWTIPMCVRAGQARDCQLLGAASLKFRAPAGTVAVPNAGGAGYYRFDLPAADWQALIAALPTLPAGEALSVDDSLWASFRAGRAPAASLIAEARAALGHPDSNASLIAGQRLAGLRLRGLIEGPALADYSRLMDGLYGPKLAAMGLDPAVGAYVAEDPDRQKLRQDLVALVVSEARDPAASAKLVAAAKAYLAGDPKALDQGYMGAAFAAHLKAGGLPAAQALLDKALSSEDAVFRGAALGAVGGSGSPEVGTWLLGLEDPRLRPLERLGLVGAMAATAETKDMAGAWILANYDRLAGGGNGIFVTSRLTSALRYQCSADRAAQVDKVLGPKIRAANKAVLDFERTVETIRHCGDLKAAREADLATALKVDS